MTLLAIELRSLNSAHYIPIIEQTIQNATSYVRIVLFLVPELRLAFDSAAKRAARFTPLQQFISALYVCCAAKREGSCDIVFADWCGYAIEAEVWNYETLHVPERMLALSIPKTEACSLRPLDQTIAPIKQICTNCTLQK